MKKKQSKFLNKPQKKRTGKKLCIFLMLVFTLILAADIANAVLSPAQRGFGPEGFSMPEGGEMPGGGFPMPDGDFPMPEGEMPSFEGGPGGNRGGRPGGFLQTLRSVWLPIAIACVLGDGLCLLLLLRMRRREKAVQEAFADMPGQEEGDSDEPSRGRRGPWGAILCLAVSFAMILAMIPAEDGDASSANVHQEVISGTAEAAEIPAVLSGAGTLEADTLTAVTVPQQVSVLKYHVRNGETVAAGDPLVTVDKTSASSAMMDLFDVLEDLDDDLEAQRQASNATYIYSTAAGRVKKIYAAEGDSVTDVLYAHGALMLLSLDGTMKVTFETGEAAAVGDAVTVRYSGITEEGRILSLREGRVTVTLSDETAWYGADATILDAQGKTLGQGKLEITSALRVISYYGKVDGISVNVGDMVSVGSTLMTLEDTGYTTDYQILLARREELETQMQKLSQLARTGTVYAENDGIVSGVPDDAEMELLSGSGGWKLMLLSSVEPAATEATVPTESTETTQTAAVLESKSDIDLGQTPASGEDGTNTGDSPGGGSDTGTQSAAYYAGKIVSLDADAGKIYVKFYNSPVAPDASLSGLTGVMTTDGEIDGTTTAQPGDLVMLELKDGKYTIVRSEAVQQTLADGNYAAYLIQASTDKLFIGLYPTALTDGNADLAALKDRMTQVDGFSFIGGNPFPLVENGQTVNPQAMVKDLKAGDLLVVKFQQGKIQDIVRAQRTVSQQPAAPDMGGQGQLPSGGMGGGMPGGDFSGGMPANGGMTAQESYEEYIVEETELLSVSDQQEVTIAMAVDELDILSVGIGMEAQVTLDAMKGQSFTGRIARISSEGTNDGGNTKFSVTVILPREAAMVDGMNASIKVVTETSAAAVTIPAAALVEDDGRTYVYTAYDQETDTLSGLTEVVTGASDGELVAILSGLESGDTFFYRYADTVTYSFLTRA